MQCPCGSKKAYEFCCGLIHQSHQAPTAEALMRSRYTAYSLGMVDYIAESMKGPAALNFDKVQAKSWSESVLWLGLRVINTEAGTAVEERGQVEFIASFLEGDYLRSIHEISEFRKIEGRWYYWEGQTPRKKAEPDRKISRNEPCPCQSKKKFKHCHGA